ncbi:threonine and proline rich protein [Mycobacterium numidiamassiliense]|uniref:Threonine and proline rich protein n=1 Tax=Mycobacterium numidiamassiliense TaxID=1841861 RepID=A0A2U3P3G2_9MYCO|nr:threonine and proline rich protein [Mycobacterium numidiamassiliense]
MVARAPIRSFRIRSIGTISNTLHDLDGLVRGYDEDYPDDDYDGAEYDDGYGELAWPTDPRWRPVAAVIGAVIAVGAVATAVVINSGDSASTKATVGPRPVTSAPATTSAPRASTSPAPGTSPAPQLPPETVTTLTPGAAPPGMITPAPLPTYLPPRAAPPLALPPTALPPAALPPTAALNPSTVIYSVAGTKQLMDFVTVVYTDAQGYPKTEFNVALPWTKEVVLNPGVTTQSVIATSIYSHLNCSVVNAQGQVVVASTNNTTMATCTR